MEIDTTIKPAAIQVFYDPKKEKDKKIKKQNIRDRIEIIKAIDKGDIQITPCNIDNLIKIDKILTSEEKESASSSIIIMGELKYKLMKFEDPLLFHDTEILIKLTFGPNIKSKKYDNSLVIEHDIYKLTNNLVMRRVSPNFMIMYGSFSCKNLYKNIKHINPEIKKRLRTILSEDVYDKNVNNILVLEKGKGGPLHSYINKVSDEQMLAILFQICYSIHAMNSNGIYHNDLHLKNVWLQPIESTTLTYFIDRETYVNVQTEYLVKFYDFDLGFYVNGKNTKLDVYGLCKEFGVCNIPNDKFDIFITMTYLYANSKDGSLVRRFIEDNISKNLLQVQWGFIGRLCNLQLPGKCNGAYRPADNIMRTPLQMIKNSVYFKPFMKKGKVPDPNIYDNVFSLTY